MTRSHLSENPSTTLEKVLWTLTTSSMQWTSTFHPKMQPVGTEHTSCWKSFFKQLLSSPNRNCDALRIKEFFAPCEVILTIV